MEKNAAVYKLECLPIEVISAIAKYLSVKDLCSCCETSSTMRDLFNDNDIWRPRFDAERVKYLRSTPAKVEPKFMIPDFNGSSLSPLPECRLSFMYENHLWNNWRLGKYKKEEIINKNSNKRNYEVVFHIFQTSDSVLAQLDDHMEFLDVRKMPAKDAIEKFPLGSRFCDSVLYTNGDMLVTALKSSVHVFQLDFSAKQCQLKHTFFFEESQNYKFNSVNELKNLINGKKTIHPELRKVMGSFFVGCLQRGSTIHVWNLDTCEKLKEATCPVKHCSVKDIQFSDTNYLVVRTQDQEQTITFLVFDLNKLVYLPFKKIVNTNKFCVYKDLVAMSSDGNLLIFNFKTSDVYMPVISVSPETNMRVLKNKMLFIFNRELQVLNLSTKKLESVSLNDVDGFELLSSKFVQIKRNFRTDIWEINSAVTTFKITSMASTFPWTIYGFLCDSFLNETCTRYIIRDGVGYLMNFW